MKVIMDSIGLRRTVIRLSHEIEERNEGLHDVVLIGVRRGGEFVAKRIAEYFSHAEGIFIPYAGIDIGTAGSEPISAFFVPDTQDDGQPVDLTGKTVVLCNDVLHTGRSAVDAIEAVFRLGRPKKIQLLVLVDRGGREVPVRADYVGKNVPTSRTEFVEVQLKELGAAEDAIAITKE